MAVWAVKYGDLAAMAIFVVAFAAMYALLMAEEQGWVVDDDVPNACSAAKARLHAERQ